MINELIFIAQIIGLSLATLGMLKIGPSALVAFISACGILANLFVLKQTSLFGFNATCADAFTIGATLGLNLLQEYHGREITKSAIGINFALLALYTIFSQLHLLFTPSIHDTMHPHFAALLQVAPRIVAASALVYLIAQLVDYSVFGALKKVTSRHLVARSYSSMLISQLVDTILFSFLGLYGIVDDIWQIIIISYTIKVVAIAIASPFVRLSKAIALQKR